ncbi:unnamed protein product [Periconia digitata]|uniref:Uncharacterized protein n=1 Tax=Periconia digitata TaxID=1303443 RepID=A0A9W4U9U8_9PLEO|nr:unnamed protein product [Periconia digitata]
MSVTLYSLHVPTMSRHYLCICMTATSKTEKAICYHAGQSCVYGVTLIYFPPPTFDKISPAPQQSPRNASM